MSYPWKRWFTAYSKSLKIILRYYIETSNDKNQITEYLKIKKIREVGKIWCCDKRLKKKKKKNESWYKRRSSNELKKKKC